MTRSAPVGVGPGGVPVILPQVVPYSVTTTVQETAAGRFVQLDVYGPSGRAVYLITAEDAEQWVRLLTEAARIARTGIVPAQGIGPG